MEKEKSRLIIFEKKEMGVFILLMMFLALSSFSLGVKLGKSISYNSAGYIPADRQNVDLKSVQEEMVEKMVTESESVATKSAQTENQTNPSSDATNNDANKIESDSEVYNKLKEEFDQFDTPAAAPTTEKKSTESLPPTSAKPEQSSEQVKPQDIPAPEGAVTAQAPAPASSTFTIQLGSYPKKDEAMNYAQGLKIRGYSPIVQEVILKDRGPWYRVSIGQFESIAMAKDYINQEESLFQGKDYIITELK